MLFGIPHPDDSKMSSNPSHLDLILQILIRGNDVTTQDIMNQTGLSRKAIHRGMYRLRKKGVPIQKETVFYI